MSAGTMQCGGPPDPCKTLLEEIKEFRNELVHRFAELRENKGNLPMKKPSQPHPRYGYRSIEGEREQFRGRQQGLRNRLNEYNTKGCGDPPPGDAWDMATMKVPEPAGVPGQPAPAPLISPQVAEAAKDTAAVGGLLLAGYVTYKLVRAVAVSFVATPIAGAASLAVP